MSLWSSLDLRRQIILVVATGAVFFGILAMARMVSAPSLTLLYAGLESSTAGEVVTALEQRGVAYDVRGGSIFVDASQRDELRLTLASEGLPENSSKGYELLDSLSGFGTTSQMFDAAYWRAKEGELARTIVSSPAISLARVHISSGSAGPFQRGIVPKASVQVTPNAGQISAQHAKAIRFLIASAVAGLEPEDVAVIDANGTLLGSGDEPQAAGDDEKSLAMKERVERLLEARVGVGNAVVEVAVETETETEEIRERRFDPEGRVAISTDTEERTSNSTEGGSGDVTVASNLPDREGGEGDSSSSQNSETRERINFEVSETEREVLRAPGSIKRLTVAVLVNDESTVSEDGQVTSSPRSDEELQSLRELVSSAVGYNEERGDVITIKSMALQSIAPTGTEVSDSILNQFQVDLMSAIQMAVLALVTLILGLFVIKPLLSRPSAPENIETAPLNQNNVLGDELSPTIDGSAPDAIDLPELDLNSSLGDLPELPGLPNMGMPADSSDPVDRLRTMIGDRQEESVQILRTWLEEERGETTV